MKHIVHVNPQIVMVKSVIEWPKCDFCGSCHPDDPSKCPRIKSFDKCFGSRRK
jgi:hypothetical protein